MCDSKLIPLSDLEIEMFKKELCFCCNKPGPDHWSDWWLVAVHIDCWDKYAIYTCSPTDKKNNKVPVQW